MKRTDITELFPDATEDQINKLMNINGGDINKVKGDLDTVKGQLAAAQSELQSLKAGQPSAELQKANDKAAALEKELNDLKQANSLRELREKVAAAKKVPASLLSGETEEACAKQADELLAFAQAGGYPAVPDGGEVGGSATTSTRDKFAKFMEENF